MAEVFGMVQTRKLILHQPFSSSVARETAASIARISSEKSWNIFRTGNRRHKSEHDGANLSPAGLQLEGANLPNVAFHSCVWATKKYS